MAEKLLPRCIRCKERREKCAAVADAIGVYCRPCREEIKHYRRTKPFRKQIPKEG